MKLIPPLHTKGLYIRTSSDLVPYFDNPGHYIAKITTVERRIMLILELRRICYLPLEVTLEVSDMAIVDTFRVM